MNELLMTLNVIIGVGAGIYALCCLMFMIDYLNDNGGENIYE